MGQSKRRGTLTDRVNQAREREKQSFQAALDAGFIPMTLDELKEKAGAPDSASFCGYVLHRLVQDDFCSSEGTWVSYPGHAFVVSNFPAALSSFLEFGLEDTEAVFATLWEDKARSYVSPMNRVGKTTPSSAPVFH